MHPSEGETTCCGIDAMAAGHVTRIVVSENGNHFSPREQRRATGRLKQNKAPADGRGKACTDNQLFGVGDASVDQGGVLVLSKFLATGVVVLASVGEYNAGLGSRRSTDVGVASVKKCSHWMVLNESKPPFRGLECMRPTLKG